MNAKTTISVLLLIVSLAWGGTILSALGHTPDEMLARADIPAGQYEELIDVLAADPVITSYGSYLREDDALIQDEHLRRYVAASAIHVWGEYHAPYPIKMVNGEFIAPEDQSAAVLSAKQAADLFASYDCIGSFVRLGDKEYTIKGVYQRRGIAALFSRTGEEEAFFSGGGPAEIWLFRLQPGKGDQKEYSLIEKLEGMGIRELSISPLFRVKKLILFMAALQGYVLLLLLLGKLSSYISGVLRSLARAFRIIGWLMLPVLTVQYVPLSPAWIPMAFTWEAVRDKAGELLILWNNARPLPTMESAQWAWLLREAVLAFLLFWLSLRSLRGKGAAHA